MMVENDLDGIAMEVLTPPWSSMAATSRPVIADGSPWSLATWSCTVPMSHIRIGSRRGVQSS